MKYIDADRLREELQKPKTELKVGNYYLDNSEQAVGYENALIDFELLIDSLQQEQDCIVINKKDWEAQEQFKKNKDFGKPLKEEQPKKSKKNCNDCPHCVDRKDQFGWHFKGCFGGPYNGKFIAEIDECPLQQEQPSLPSNLDEAAEKCVTSIIYEYGSYDGDFLIPVCKDIFKAGAEWQKEQDDKLVDIIYQQGIEKGKDEMRETLKKKEK